MRVVLPIVFAVLVSVSVYGNESDVLYDKFRIIKRHFIVVFSIASQANSEELNTATSTVANKQL